MSLKLKTTSNGSVTLSPQDTASDVVVTVPAGNATMLTTENGTARGPAFSAYQSMLQTLTTSVVTKITFTSIDWDETSGMYASSRFTPTVAGYYQINACTALNTTGGAAYSSIYKNGSEWKRGAQSGNVAWTLFPVSAFVYCNGSTDYIEIYFSQTTGANQNTITGSHLTYFQAALVRAT